MEKLVSEIQEIKVHGRTTECRSPITLFWTASGIECNVSGTELSIEVEVEYDTFEPWFSYTLNGDWIGRQMLTKGRYWIPLFRGMSPQTIKNVRFYRDLQAMSDDVNSLIHIHALRYDGTFYPVEDKKRKIEFIGDSITSGEGLFGAKQEEDWIPMFFSALRGYPNLVANKLEADYRIFSQSGWGIHHGWDNNLHNRLPQYYNKICGFMDKAGGNYGAGEEYDFTKWQPDVCVINLGTNDASGFDQPAWRDALSGESYKAERMSDGSLRESDVSKIRKSITEFISLVRLKNPTALIIWCYGMLGDELLPSIKEAVETYSAENADKKVVFLRLPDTTEETVGSRCHPGGISHEKAAEVLYRFIADALF